MGNGGAVEQLTNDEFFYTFVPYKLPCYVIIRSYLFRLTTRIRLAFFLRVFGTLSAISASTRSTGDDPPLPFPLLLQRHVYFWFAPSFTTVTVATCGATGEGPKSLTELVMPIGNHRFI